MQVASFQTTKKQMPNWEWAWETLIAGGGAGEGRGILWLPATGLTPMRSPASHKNGLALLPSPAQSLAESSGWKETQWESRRSAYGVVCQLCSPQQEL